MKQLKFILSFTILVCLLSYFKQDGFKIIEDARFSYEQGKLDHALVLLEKAYSSYYGNCGNSYLEAFGKITDLKAKIYLDKREYQLVRTILDSSNSYGGNLDSLRILSYKLEIGPDSLSRMIDSSLSNVVFESDELSYFNYAVIPLINGKDTIRIEAEDGNRIHNLKFDETNTDQWITEFMLSKKYKMIKETVENKSNQRPL